MARTGQVRAIHEWVGGRVALPAYVTGEDKPFRPEIFLWLESPEDSIVFQEIVTPVEELPFGDTLLAAMESPMVGPARRPERIRVASSDLAAEIRDVAPDIEVRVAPTPEINRVMDAFASFIGTHGDSDNEEKASYFENGRVSEASIDGLFRAARLLYLTAPWEKLVDDRQFLRLDIPALDVEGACVSVIGTLGEELGLIIFPSLTEAKHFLRFAGNNNNRSGDGPVDLGTSMLVLYFERATELPPPMRREAARHGWPVADTAAYPLVTHRDSDGMMRPLGEWDVHVARACALGVVDFFEKHPDLLKQGYLSESVGTSVIVGDDVEARITALDETTLRETAPYETGFETGFETNLSSDNGSDDAPGGMFAGLSPDMQSKIVLQFKDTHYGQWPDEPLPALNGETPRQAVKTGAGRRRVDELLREFEDIEAREPEDTRYDFSTIRRELGLGGA